MGWHELLATDRDSAFAFYSSLFDWRKANADSTPAPDSYQMFAAGEQAIGGIFTKPATAPVPFWLLYFNVDDIDAAVAQVTANGGRILEGPIGLPDGWIARCVDPQDAMFALLGHRTRGSTATDSAIGWSASWAEFHRKAGWSPSAARCDSSDQFSANTQPTEAFCSANFSRRTRRGNLRRAGTESDATKIVHVSACFQLA